MANQTAQDTTILYIYTDSDEPLCHSLVERLDSFQRQGLITQQWYDHLLEESSTLPSLDPRFDAASVILLLLSPAFFQSTYCIHAMQHSMLRHDRGEALVIPILLYPLPGNWQEKDFARLQVLPTGAHAITAWADTNAALLDVTMGIRKALRPSVIHAWNVPYQRNLFFTGQEQILTQLAQTLQQNQSAALTQPQAISGLGGIGKTEIAVEYAYRYRENYDVVVWAQAESVEVLISSYARIASLLQLPEKDAQDQQEMVRAVRNWFNTHDRWLLILDNANNPVELQDLLPTEPTGHMLLTTRARVSQEVAQNVEVSEMHSDIASLFLLRRAGMLPLSAALEQATASDRAGAIQIVQVLGGLPLALDQAGAYIRETGTGLADYLARYERYRAQTLSRRGRTPREYPASVATTWSISFQQVEEKSAVAADVLRLCAYLAPDVIPQELLADNGPDPSPHMQALEQNPQALLEAIQTLEAYSLIRRLPIEKSLSIHRLVQAVLIDTMSEEQQTRWVQRAIFSVNWVFPQHAFSPEHWANSERFIAHIQNCVHFVQQHPKSVTPIADALFMRAGTYLMNRGHYTDSGLLSLLQTLALIKTTTPSPTSYDASRIRTLGLQARAYCERGNYTQAERLYLDAIKMAKQQLDSLNHKEESSSRPDMQSASLLGMFDIWRPDLASLYEGLASVYMKTGRYDEAERSAMRAIKVWESSGPTRWRPDPNIAVGLNTLALIYVEQGKYDRAEPHFKDAIAIWKHQRKNDAITPIDINIAGGYNNLGLLYTNWDRNGDDTLAEQAFQRSLAIWAGIQDSNHPSLGDTQNNLARLYHKQQKYTEAEALFQSALKIRKQTYGPRHFSIGDVLNNLAVMYGDQGRYVEAEDLYKQAYSIDEEALGANHPKVAMDLGNLGVLYMNQERYEGALPLLERAYNIHRQVAKNDAQLAPSAVALAKIYEMLDRKREAQQLYKQAMKLYEHMLGPGHETTQLVKLCYMRLL